MYYTFFHNVQSFMHLKASSDRDNEMGAKKSLELLRKPKNSLEQNLTPKKSHAKFPSHRKVLLYSQNYHKSDSFEHLQNSLIKSSYPIKYLAKFSHPKKSPRSKILNPKNPSLMPVTQNPG